MESRLWVNDSENHVYSITPMSIPIYLSEINKRGAGIVDEPEAAFVA